MHKINLSYQQALNLSLQAFDEARDEIEEVMIVPSCQDAGLYGSGEEFICVREIYLSDLAGAVDIEFSLNGKRYLFTVEQSADGRYCSAFDRDYNHVATEIKDKRRRQ